MGSLRRARGRPSHTTQPPTPQARGDTICRFEDQRSSFIRCVTDPVCVIMQLTPENKEPEFGLSQLGQVALRIHDVDRAIEFYRDALSMKFLFSTGTMAFFDCGGVRLMLSMPERG